MEGPPLHDNINSLLAAPEEPVLPDGELDHLLVVNAMHGIPKRARYLKKLARILKPTGRLTVIDWHDGDIGQAPPPEERLDRDIVVAELEKADWSLITESVTLPYQYLLILHPPGAK
jgi:ubiquinone/menaquinone biosynthesis C-methylase UbiE